MLLSCIDVDLAVAILTVSRSFFLLWIWTVTITGPNMKDLPVFKGTFRTFVGGDSDH